MELLYITLRFTTTGCLLRRYLSWLPVRPSAPTLLLLRVLT